ncbi:unnamed protein product [Trichogramma brassicae]|uniref:DUF1308 domain-containing protein n=1 Tax=Trichogramma brassicae TaxID=86971 RepID=A0A6H5HZA0_9HYME|nr:unnamed protein product [Trichogramma brassicae]
METQELLKCFDEKIEWGWQMIEKLKQVHKVEGIDKLIRKIQQEVKFLKKVRSTGNVKKEHLQSTNLIHLNAIVERLLSANEPVSVLKPFKNENSRLEVDIVCNGGSSWVKVIARNAKALTLISCGNAEYGQKSVLDQAEAYLKCAKNYPHMYKPPDIIFYFACGIEIPLAQKLENSLNIIVEGKKIDVLAEDDVASDDALYSESDSQSESSSNSNLCNLLELNKSIETKSIGILNLDVSTLLAYVTNMTNGHANFLYVEPLLNQQAMWERSSPLKPVLDQLFQDKELIVCQTAYDNFTNIINLIVKIVNDIPQGRVMELSLGGKIKERSRLVFATGENFKSITVSANEGFVRAARMQGVECMVFIHEPRSLSEIKELSPLDPESS